MLDVIKKTSIIQVCRINSQDIERNNEQLISWLAPIQVDVERLNAAYVQKVLSQDIDFSEPVTVTITKIIQTDIYRFGLGLSFAALISSPLLLEDLDNLLLENSSLFLLETGETSTQSVGSVIADVTKTISQNIKI